MFALEKEPFDYQVSLHLNNMFDTYSKSIVLIAYDYIRDPKCDYTFVYDTMRPSDDNEKMHVALYNLTRHYGFDKIDCVLSELFSIGNVA